MKSKIKTKTATDAAFSPVVLKLTFETKAELAQMVNFLGGLDNDLAQRAIKKSIERPAPSIPKNTYESEVIRVHMYDHLHAAYNGCE